MRTTDLMNNTPMNPDDCGSCDSMPNAGVNTGVTDEYGGGLDKGYQSPKKIPSQDVEYAGFA